MSKSVSQVLALLLSLYIATGQSVHARLGANNNKLKWGDEDVAAPAAEEASSQSPTSEEHRAASPKISFGGISFGGTITDKKPESGAASTPNLGFSFGDLDKKTKDDDGSGAAAKKGESTSKKTADSSTPSKPDSEDSPKDMLPSFCEIANYPATAHVASKALDVMFPHLASPSHESNGHEKTLRVCRAWEDKDALAAYEDDSEGFSLGDHEYKLEIQFYSKENVTIEWDEILRIVNYRDQHGEKFDIVNFMSWHYSIVMETKTKISKRKDYKRDIADVLAYVQKKILPDSDLLKKIKGLHFEGDVFSDDEDCFSPGKVFCALATEEKTSKYLIFFGIRSFILVVIY